MSPAPLPTGRPRHLPQRAPFRRSRIGLLALLAALCWASQADAGGWSSLGAGATRVGMSAVVAKVDDATAIYHNVANLSLRRGQEFHASSIFGYATASGKVLQSIDPDTGEDFYSETFEPNVNYAAFPFLSYVSDFGTDKWRFGVANYFPNLAGGSLDPESPARYLIVEGYFMTNYTSFAAAYKVSETLAVGASLDFIYARQQGNQKINLFDLTEGTGIPDAVRGLLDGLADIQAKRSTDTFTLGYHLGLHYKPAENVSIGLTYFEQSVFVMDGDLRLVAPDEEPFYEAFLGVTEVTAQAEQEYFVPRTIRIGMNFVVNPKWNWGLDLTWWDYSYWDEQRITYPDIDDTVVGQLFPGILPSVSIAPKNYDDSWEVAVGAEHTVNERWKVRFGFQYDDSPIPNETFTIDSITADQWGITAGFEYAINPGRSLLGIGFQHREVKKRDIRNSLTNPPNNVKIIQSFADSIMVEWKYFI